MFKIEYTPGPCISWAIIIDKHLVTKTFLYGEEIYVSLDCFSPKLRTPFSCDSLDQVKQLIDSIDLTITLPCQ